MDRIAGKRFLITHSIVHGIMGSTVVTLELAQFLQQRGAAVTVYAAFIGEPAAGLFRERGVELVDDETYPDLPLGDLDYVWVHSQVLPVPLVDRLGGPLPQRMPTFIFLHMSAVDVAPDEHPYIPGLEERLSSLSLFVSSTTLDGLLPHYHQPPATGIFPNPAPAAYAATPYRPKPAPERILIVSNHSPPEVAQARNLLRRMGYDVRHVGAPHDLYVLVTPDMIVGSDVVVTIGKTVQYCLLAGVPVYNYDRHGGCGYFTEANFDTARRRNFSGRGEPRRSPGDLVSEILAGYLAATQFHADRRSQFESDFGIDDVLPLLIEGVTPRAVDAFEPSEVATFRSAQEFGSRFYRSWGRLTDAEHAVHLLRAENEALRAQVSEPTQPWRRRMGRAVSPPSFLRDARRKRPEQ